MSEVVSDRKMESRVGVPVSMDKRPGMMVHYGVKERETHHALGDYDFGARIHNAARGSFAQPDPLAEKYRAVNPYAYCAADPVNHTDPTGAYIVNDCQEEWDYQKSQLKKKKEEILNEINSARNAGKDYSEETKRLEGLNSSIYTMERLEKSVQGYSLSHTTQDSETSEFSFDPNSKIINLKFSDTGTFAHELTHAGQFEDGKLAFNAITGDPILYDVIDEVEAYRAQYAYVGSLPNSVFGKKFDMEMITIGWVQNLTNTDGIKIYSPGVNIFIGMKRLDVNSTYKKVINSLPWFRTPDGIKDDVKFISTLPVYSIGRAADFKIWKAY